MILPYANGEKTRKGIPTGERRFFFTQGRTPCLYNTAGIDLYETVFLVEGETDTMRLWQELHDAEEKPKATVVGLSGIHTWQPGFADVLSRAKQVFVILDNDEDYNVKAQVDAAWKAIRHDLGPKARRIRLPNGTKDVCEFFTTYDLDLLRMMAQKGSAPSRYRALDLTQEPPPPNWLLENLVSKGDVTLLPGPSGLGKSWLTMGITIATIEGHETFLGADMKAHGSVLYVDSENPDDVIFHRLRKLGLTSEGMTKLRYLWNQGIRLDRDPDEFLEEAMAFRPTLIVLDSLTRLHTQDENSAGSMAQLFNDAIQPLARETGASVLLIHHDSRAGNPRGSVDIEASVDNVLHVKSAGEQNPGTFILRQGKSRRRLGGDELVVRIEDRPDGTTHLRTSAPLNPPF